MLSAAFLQHPCSRRCLLTSCTPTPPNSRESRQWRARQSAPPAGQLRLYYAIFAEVAAAVAALLERGIVHFDLKCDNCLLEPLPGKWWTRCRVDTFLFSFFRWTRCRVETWGVQYTGAATAGRL